MRRLTVIIPTYNEESHIVETMTNALDREGISYVVIDDGSDIPLECNHVIRREKNKGYGNAIKLGMREYTNTTYIGIIDADGQYDVVDLIHLWKSMDDEDMLIGKRITHQGSWKRFLGRMFIRLTASLFAGYWIPDCNSGLRIFKKSIAKSYYSILCDQFSFTTSLTLSMLLDGYKVRWANIGFYPREGSPSTVRMIHHGLITLYQILRITFALRTRKIRKRLR